MACLLGIDSGLTVTKAVVFDEAGRQLAVARREVGQLLPVARHVERDMSVLWTETAEAIREALEQSGRPPTDIVCVAATAHGDGIYLLDGDRAPLGPGILSLDSRAGSIVAKWQEDGVAERALAVSGQVPHVSAPSALLAWIREHEPERYAAVAHILSCKDWLRYCLTGAIGTDRTEASTSFTDVRSQQYAADILNLYGLDEVLQALPPVGHSAELAGQITSDAALATGLTAGTPVAYALHDVTASALGIGGQRAGCVDIVAGTYSINEIVSKEPKVDARWFCRNAVAPDVWNNMSISPSSTTNYDWFLSTFCALEKAAPGAFESVHDLLAPEIEAALARPSSVIYHPFLFGSPYGELPSAGFFGLRGWHERGDVLAALLEGIVFNHRYHVEALRNGFPANAARLTGGASRNPVVAQLFADIMGIPVTVTETDEAAAWGAALCAGAAVGLFGSFDADPRDLSAMSTLYVPDLGRAAHYNERYRVYCEVAAGLADAWQQLDDLSHAPRLSRD